MKPSSISSKAMLPAQMRGVPAISWPKSTAATLIASQVIPAAQLSGSVHGLLQGMAVRAVAVRFCVGGVVSGLCMRRSMPR
jgi:hypothetical protein